MSEGKAFLDPWEGRHNQSDYESRLLSEGLYKDRSTVCIVPTRGQISARVVQAWLALMPPMNQKFIRLIVEKMEVGAAYEHAIDTILSHPELRTWNYVLTLEDDNMPPPDGLLKLYRAIDEGYDAVGGLYWTKGEGGQPMCYGDPGVFPLNFLPQIPRRECVTRCNGLGMGFTLFKMELFTSGKIERPFFKTLQEFDPQKGGSGYTQDLYFFEKASRAGYRFGCDSRVRVGHFDGEIVW